MLNFTSVLQEAEKNAEIWRKKYDVAEIDIDRIYLLNVDLEKQLEDRQLEIDVLNEEKKVTKRNARN